MGGGGSKSSSTHHETINRNEHNTFTNVKNEKNVLNQKDVINRVQYGDRAKKGIVEGANSVNNGYAVYGLMELDDLMMLNQKKKMSIAHMPFGNYGAGEEAWRARTYP